MFENFDYMDIYDLHSCLPENAKIKKIIVLYDIEVQ